MPPPLFDDDSGSRGRSLTVRPLPATVAPRPPASTVPAPAIGGALGGGGLYGSLLGPTLERRGAGEDRRGGADTETDQALLRVAQAITEQSADIAVLARAQAEEKKGVRGTARSLSREEEDLILLVRGCDQYNVSVCPSTVGRHLVVALKEAAIGAGGALRQAGWSVPMRNRLAIGVAGGFWGGRTLVGAENIA